MKDTPRILATYVAQRIAENGDVENTGKTQDFNVTKTILNMPVAEIKALEDDQYETDALVAEASRWARARSLKHPFAIRVEDDLALFFEGFGCNLLTLTQEQVDRIRTELGY
jgi:hypothetical protein